MYNKLKQKHKAIACLMEKSKFSTLIYLWKTAWLLVLEAAGSANLSENFSEIKCTIARW